MTGYLMNKRMFLVAGLFLLSATPAWADGIINAVSFRPFERSIPIAVSPLDNSDLNMAIKEDIEAELKSAGFKVDDKSLLVLTFETRSETGTWGSSDRRSVLEVEGHGGKKGDDYQKARLNIFDSGRGGLLNEGENPTTAGTPNRYRIDMTLDDRQAKHRVWQGWAVADLELHEKVDLARAMIPVITRGLGKTIRRESFEVKPVN